MTTPVDIANRALLSLGLQKKINTLTQDSVEAAATNAIISPVRDDLLRMAPWNCATDYTNLVMISAVPGTPENQGPATLNWQPGQPAPPWAYEYLYPSECLRPLWVIPQFTTGFSSGIPITTAVTGGAPAFWNGPPVRFKVALDQIRPIASLSSVSAPGSGYAVGDTVDFAIKNAAGTMVGGIRVTVNTLSGSGINGVSLGAGASFISGVGLSGDQIATSGSGSGAVCNFTVTAAAADQRTILTNQEFGTLAQVKQVTDPNVMDSIFVEAWTAILAARLALVLLDNRDDAKAIANMKITEANTKVAEARRADGNEGLTINDVTPDWLRVRGINFANFEYSPNMQYDWGPMFTPY